MLLAALKGDGAQDFDRPIEGQKPATAKASPNFCQAACAQAPARTAGRCGDGAGVSWPKSEGKASVDSLSTSGY